MINLKVLLMLAGLVTLAVASKDIVLEMTKKFAKPAEACRKEMELPESVSKDFMNFWKEDYELTDRHTGCAIICLSEKLDLLDESLNLHHGNAMEFAKAHGADDAKAKQLIDLIHECSVEFPEINDPCQRALDVTKCFKAKIHKLDWAPSMELIVAEILAEG